MRNIFLVITCIVFYSCSHYSSDIEAVLKQSGRNRGELEKVLKHYSCNPADSLKYKAAVFLIENLTGHYSYKDTSYYHRFYDGIDSLAQVYKHLDTSKKDSMYIHYLEMYCQGPQTIVSDTKIISSFFLIDNIDRSFKVWKESAWAEHVDFNHFCEYILPYKIEECQDLDNWREYFEFFCDGNLRTHQYCDLYRNSAFEACKTVNKALNNRVEVRLYSDYGNVVKRMKSIPNILFGSCEDYNILAASVMRAKGIPCVIDFTPQWPFRSMGHSWCVLLKNTGAHAIFEGVAGEPGLPHKDDHKMAKVFRNTYAVNKEIEEIQKTEKYIPDLLYQKCMIDVSDEYMNTSDIQIDINSSKNKYAYLSVFDNQNWIPIHWGKITGKKVTFKKMGRDILYLPVLYNKNGIVPFADPFIFTVKEEIVWIRPDTVNKRSLTLSRKYPVFPAVYELCGRVVGGVIEASNNADFKNADTLHVITEYGLEAREIRLDSIEKSYRFWRYLSPKDGFCNMAEIYFFEKDSIHSTTGKILGTEGSYQSGGKYTKTAVFDRDILTYFDAPVGDAAWVGMDFGRPVRIKRIVYAPRGDGNYIEMGDEYELLYWINNQWKSLGRKKADGVTLYYENCPNNALFLLHDLTKGKEERIFTYENGQQVWW